MERNLDLNKLRLEADEQGFTLNIISNNLTTPSVVGMFDTPDFVTCNQLRTDVLDSYADQPEVEAVFKVVLVDSGSEREIALEATIHLNPGANWFELDHTKFNEVYCE